jgi:hypothetical protein
LFRVRLTNFTGGPVTVDRIIFQLSAVNGIDAVDLSDLVIHDGTSTVSTGGAASITAPTGTITFDGDFNVPDGGAVNYVLFGDATQLAFGETLTIGLDAGDITLASGSVLGSAVTDATHTVGALGPLISYSDFDSGFVTRPLEYSTFSPGAWAAPGSIAVAGPFTDPGFPLHQKEAYTSPNRSQQVVVFKEDNTGGRDKIWVSFWDGTNWDDGNGAPYGDAKDFGNTWDLMIDRSYRNFDAAYEPLSGELLVAAGINTANSFKFWVYDKTSWSSFVQENIPGPGNRTHEWIRLAPRPGSNQIALIALANDTTMVGNAEVRGAIWDGDGNTWISKTSFGLGTSYYTTDAADIDFVLGGMNLGEAIAVWGAEENVWSKVWSESSGWTANIFAADLGVGNTVKWVRQTADPNTDDLIVAIEDVNEQIYTLRYDGDTRAWGSLTQHPGVAFGDADDNRAVDIASYGANRVVLTYSDATGIKYRISNDGGVSWEPEQALTSTRAYWIQMVRDPNGTVHLGVLGNEHGAAEGGLLLRRYVLWRPYEWFTHRHHREQYSDSVGRPDRQCGRGRRHHLWHEQNGLHQIRHQPDAVRGPDGHGRHAGRHQQFCGGPHRAGFQFHFRCRKPVR